MHVGWTISEIGGNRGTFGSLRLRCDELGQSDPFFTSEFMDWAQTTDSEATWNFIWDVQSQNCSGTDNYKQISQILQTRQVIFTTKKGAQQPDVLQGTSACARSPGVTFNVTDTMSIDASSNLGRDSCNVLAPGPSPVANVCAIAMGPAVAATATKITPQSLCESVGTTASSTTTAHGNAAARGRAALGRGCWVHVVGITLLRGRCAGRIVLGSVQSPISESRVAGRLDFFF
ncbi:hypothetical protein C8A01DRAFT_34038 [Parachaetomium inaequale]|uniref:DUF7136 domain-containing protein n=1 Tax=Parachaetomium inaequale TaxID=2588326 RepID=A0AAN6PJ35_9PEZI|nr:hypothetical protein C8A01DRAFT_34038 [Parachaetomium inaequale]